MPAKGLTHREWYLVRQVEKVTLRAVIKGCETTGMPGKIIAGQILQLAVTGRSNPILQAGCEEELTRYKPDAG